MRQSGALSVPRRQWFSLDSSVTSLFSQWADADVIACFPQAVPPCTIIQIETIGVWCRVVSCEWRFPPSTLQGGAFSPHPFLCGGASSSLGGRVVALYYFNISNNNKHQIVENQSGISALLLRSIFSTRFKSVKDWI